MELKDNLLELYIEDNLLLARKIHKALNIGSSPEAYAFIMSGMELIFKKKFSEKDFLDIITDGGNDIGIDAVYSDNDYINIFDFKNASKQASKSSLVVFKKNFEDYVLQKPVSYINLNTQIKKKLIYIHNKNNKKKKIRLFFVRSKNVSKPLYIRDMYKDFSKIDSNIKIEYYDRDLLIGSISESDDYKGEWEFNLSQKEDKFFFDKDNAFLKVRLIDLLKLVDDTKINNQDIFNKNIRQDLRKKIFSTNMLETLRNEPNKFFIYHNGITITTEKNLKVTKTTTITIKRPQIVNGAQTLGALYKYFKENNELNNKILKKAKILCKVVYADNEYTSKICETTNTQTPVTLADLRSNDDIQFLLEKTIDRLSKYKYLRKSGMQSSPGVMGIKLTDFMQWFYSADFGKPADAKNKKRYIFSLIPEKRGGHSIYKAIENRLYKKDRNELKLLCDIGIFVSKEINNTRSKIKKGFIRHANMHIIAGLYLLKSTKKKDFNSIIIFLEKYYKEQIAISPELNENKVFTKKDETWKELKKHLKK